MSEINELKEYIQGGGDVKDFSMAGVVLKPAYCCSGYDGDTIDVVSKYMGSYYRFTLRMMGYDSPEKRTKKKDLETKEEIKTRKMWANYSKEHLLWFVENNYNLKVVCIKEDKYGRVLANIFITLPDGKEFNVNEEMIQNGYCVPYGVNGDLHKKEWDYSSFVYAEPGVKAGLCKVDGIISYLESN